MLLGIFISTMFFMTRIELACKLMLELVPIVLKDGLDSIDSLDIPPDMLIPTMFPLTIIITTQTTGGKKT